MNESYHQGSFEITDGAFVPEAPQPDQRPGKFDSELANQAHWAHQAALGGPGHDYDPNARRAAQTEGAGGGITEALTGELNSKPGADEQVIRPLRIGSFYDGRPIRNDVELQQAINGQRAEQVRRGKRSIARQPGEQLEANQRGIEHARARVERFSPQTDSWERSPYTLREGDVAFDPQSELGAEELRPVPNSEASRKAS